MEDDIITRKKTRTDWFGVTFPSIKVYFAGEKRRAGRDVVFLRLWGRELRPSPVNNTLLRRPSHIFQMSDSRLVLPFPSDGGHRVKAAELLERKADYRGGGWKAESSPTPTHNHTHTHTHKVKSVIPVWIKSKTRLQTDAA